MKDLQTYYRRSLRDRIAEFESLGEPLGRNDPEAVSSAQKIAHRLKGTGASYGFPEITRAAETVLQASENELARAAETLVEVLRGIAFGPDAGSSVVLLVEDDPEMLRLLEAKLQASERTILQANTAAEANEVLAREDVALVLLDLVLPDEDGRQLLARLRQNPRYAATPVLVISAALGPQVRAECYALGADELFEKPVDLPALAAAVAAKLVRAREIARETRQDLLTGLLNRAGLASAFERARALAERADYPLCLALVDLDRFKWINDNLGHAAGDRALRQVAEVFVGALRKSDRVGRWGGDELVVLFPNSDLRGASQALAKVAASLRRDVFEPGGDEEFRLEFSAGVVAVGDGTTLEMEVMAADELMYAVKTAGGGRVLAAGERVDSAAKRVLIADDDTQAAELVRRRFQDAGFEVHCSHDGFSALEAASEGDVDLLILDVLMPGLNGFDLLERLRQLPAHRRTPVIMLTSLGSEQDLLRGFDLGADDYVTKPFSTAELLARARRLLARR